MLKLIWIVIFLVAALSAAWMFRFEKIGDGGTYGMCYRDRWTNAMCSFYGGKLTSIEKQRELSKISKVNANN